MSNPNSCLSVLEHFRKCVPKRPYATDKLSSGIWLQPKWAALKQPYIQANHGMIWCLIFDCDHDGAACAAQDGLLPNPNFCVLNQLNGRGHLCYLLKDPVSTSDASRQRPIRYLARIQRGMTERLDADAGYAGLIVKNPVSACWRTIIVHGHLFSLGELNAYLHEKNCRRRPTHEVAGLGRNCTLFDELRLRAYRRVRDFDGMPYGDFETWALGQASAINAQFAIPLMQSEARAVAKSVAKWVWKKFDVESFRVSQSQRGRKGNAKRWADHVSLETSRPWEADGVSRSTFFRRKARQRYKNQ